MASLEESCPGPWPSRASEPAAELVARAQAGDRGALDDIVARYQERLLRIVRIRLGPASTDMGQR